MNRRIDEHYQRNAVHWNTIDGIDRDTARTSRRYLSTRFSVGGRYLGLPDRRGGTRRWARPFGVGPLRRLTGRDLSGSDGRDRGGSLSPHGRGCRADGPAKLERLSLLALLAAHPAAGYGTGQRARPGLL